MRAIRLHEFGGPEKLVVEETDLPRPRADEVLVRVHACGVCYLDVIVRSGMRSHAALPLTLGHEIAGVITETGPNVRGFAVGDRVASTYRIACGHCRYCRDGQSAVCDNRQGIGEHRNGGYAEYVALPESAISRVPLSVCLEQACICGCVIGAVYVAVVKKAAVRPGQTVLVTGAGGGVGVHALQLSRLAGARVIAVTSSEHKVERIKELGADEVILSRRGSDFSAEVMRLTDGRGAEVVVEGVGSATFPATFRSIAKAGRLVFVGEISGQPAQFNPALMIYKEIVLTGAQSANAEELTQVLELVAGGRIKPIIGEILPIEQAARAHQMLAENRNFGRLVLQVGS